MKTRMGLPLLCAFLFSTSAGATKLPLPIENANLYLALQLQAFAQEVENGTPDGKGFSTETLQAGMYF